MTISKCSFAALFSGWARGPSSLPLWSSRRSISATIPNPTNKPNGSPESSPTPVLNSTPFSASLTLLGANNSPMSLEKELTSPPLPSPWLPLPCCHTLPTLFALISSFHPLPFLESLPQFRSFFGTLFVLLD